MKYMLIWGDYCQYKGAILILFLRGIFNQVIKDLGTFQKI